MRMIRKRQSERSGGPFEIVMRGCHPGIKQEAANSEWRIASRGFRRLALVLLLTLLATGYSLVPLFAQTKTTVSDTIHAPDGALPSGRIVIKSESTFTAADGTVVFQGTVATTTVTDGAFSVALVPTAGSMPAGASYQALYELSGVPYHTE